MARDFSDEYVRSLQFPNHPLLHVALRARPLINGLRVAQRLTSSPPVIRTPEVGSGAQIGSAFDAGSEQFRTKGWTFVDPFFTAPMHDALLAGWPQRRYLDPPSDLVKSYDRGFNWRRYAGGDPPYLDRHPALRAAFTELRSDAFARRVSAFAGGKHDLGCFSMLVTRSWPGSNVAPHRDTTAYKPEGEHFLNIAIFVDGTGGEHSGGLAILGSNTFDDVIFESSKLRNTALIYATAAPFYHGFPPIQWGKFRWALLAQFCDRSFRGKDSG